MKLSLCLAAILALVQATSPLAQGQPHTDAAHDFRITAPVGWGAAPLVGRMAWHVASEGGRAMPDCSVIVTTDASFSHVTPEEYIGSQSEAQLKKFLTLNFTEVVVGNWEPNFRLGNQIALHSIYSGTLDGRRQTSLVLQTIHSGKLYTFSCNAPSESFPSIYADLLSIADSFSFLQVDATEQPALEEPTALPSSTARQSEGLNPPLVTWFILFSIACFVPYTYWRIARHNKAHIAIRLLSYLGVLIIGAIAGILLWATKIIGTPWISFVAVMFCVAHYYGLRFIAKANRKCGSR